ncbi:MAG: hypothetical protein Fur0037_08080 [Planctomycetota bacterium]
MPDGADSSPRFRLRPAEIPRRPLIWRFPGHLEASARLGIWRARPGSAIRLGGEEAICDYEAEEWPLFDLDRDPGEEKDLSGDRPRAPARAGGDAARPDRGHEGSPAPQGRKGVRPRRRSLRTPRHTLGMKRLFLISNSTMHGRRYLEHCRDEMAAFLEGRPRVAFVPYALADHAAYAARAKPAFDAAGAGLFSVHEARDPAGALEGADAVFVGGGNTFRLLDRMQRTGLLDAIRERVAEGMAYLGGSAGANVAAPTIRTTNDMPIVEPRSFEALGLVPFQINPHYLDSDPASRHMGETREERIRQFHEENDAPVLALREGCWLAIDGPRVELEGTASARLFRKNQEPEEFAPLADLGFLAQA